jgi:hypothetical protein
MTKIYTIWNAQYYPKMPIITHTLCSVRAFIERHPEVKDIPLVINFKNKCKFDNIMGSCRYSKPFSVVVDQVDNSSEPDYNDDFTFAYYAEVERIYCDNSSEIVIQLDHAYYNSIKLTNIIWHELEHHRQYVTGLLRDDLAAHTQVWNDSEVYPYKSINTDYDAYFNSPWEVAARKKGEESEQWFIGAYGSNNARVLKKTKSPTKQFPRTNNKGIASKKLDIWMINDG